MYLIEKFREQIEKNENKELVKKLKLEISKWIFKLNEDIKLYELIIKFTTFKEKMSENFEYLQEIKNTKEIEKETEEEKKNNAKKIKLCELSKEKSVTAEELGYEGKKFSGQILFLAYIYSTFSEKDVDLYLNIKNTNALVWYHSFYLSAVEYKKIILIEEPVGKNFLSELCYLFLMRLDNEQEIENLNFFNDRFLPMLTELNNSSFFCNEKLTFLEKRTEVINLLDTVFSNMFKTKVHKSLEKNVIAYKDEIKIIIKALPIIVTTPDFIFHRIVQKFYLTVCRTHQSIRSTNIFGAFFLLHFFTATQIYLVFEDLNKYLQF